MIPLLAVGTMLLSAAQEEGDDLNTAFKKSFYLGRPEIFFDRTRWIPIGDRPEVFDRIEAWALGTITPGGDLGDPVLFVFSILAMNAHDELGVLPWKDGVIEADRALRKQKDVVGSKAALEEALSWLEQPSRARKSDYDYVVDEIIVEIKGLLPRVSSIRSEEEVSRRMQEFVWGSGIEDNDASFIQDSLYDRPREKAMEAFEFIKTKTRELFELTEREIENNIFASSRLLKQMLDKKSLEGWASNDFPSGVFLDGTVQLAVEAESNCHPDRQSPCWSKVKSFYDKVEAKRK